MRILVIDDSRIIQSGIRRALAKAGHEVTVAGDGNEGLSAARHALPDLIMLDMMLPGMSGTEVLSALKKDSTTKEIPVIVLTGLSQKNESKLLEAGAMKYFEKSDRFFDHNFSTLREEVDRCSQPVS